MSCNLTTTTTQCKQCIHPFDYIFDLITLGLSNQSYRENFSGNLDRLLDKGIVETNCKLCCPDCDNIYVFASVETFLRFTEEIYGISVIGMGQDLECQNQSDFQKGCCTNIHASVETWLKVNEGLFMDQNGDIDPDRQANFPSCCNGFTECVEELNCWVTQNVRNSEVVVDILIDKGIVEYGNIVNNCTGAGTSSLCKLTELLSSTYAIDKNAQKTSKVEIIGRILDKGIVIYCNADTGDIIIASVETFSMVYAPAFNLNCGTPA